MDQKVRLKVQGLTNSQVQSGAYALILSEKGPRRIPVIVGVSEAQSIAIALEGLNPPRPLTHDLFIHLAQAFQIYLSEVFIYKFEDGVFYSELVFWDGTRETRIDSRTSDAIAIALRINCPIYTLESIIQQCGVVIDEASSEKDEPLLSKDLNPEEIQDPDKLRKWLSLMQGAEIESRMQKAIGEENYESAKIYKDELARRKRLGGIQAP